MSARPLLLLFALSACRGEEDTASLDPDADLDGVSADEDCDDSDANVFPGNTESCDGVDNDCDGAIDNDATDAGTWYVDGDGDGWGGQDSQTACSQPLGHVAQDGDCDDSSPRYHPGAAEENCADPEDYNCDGSVGYEDEDQDGWPACEDCDDSSASANPDADEVCDGADNDCDGDVDQDATDATDWYGDADGDGFGGTVFVVTECEPPAGYVASSDDCDDLDPSSYPGGTETCDEADNNCDGTVDEDVQSTFYLDTDGDGYGDPDISQQACSAPTGTSHLDTDCDDSDPSAHPGGTEVCDGVDQNCDGDIDEGLADEWWPDLDGDGYGAGTGTEACEQPSGYVDNEDDCDDTEELAWTGATEVADGVDNDCDGSSLHGVFNATSNRDLAGGAYEYDSFDIAGGVTVTVTGTDPLEVYVLGDAAIDGTLDLSGSNGGPIGDLYTNAAAGSAGGGGGGSGGLGGAYNGTHPITADSGGGDAPGVGGIGYSSGSGGGGGGQAADGTQGGASGGCYTAYAGGLGGTAVSSTSTATLQPGSGGGGGGHGTGYNSGGGGGGGGGGAFFLDASNIDVAGAVTCTAGDGGGTNSCLHAGGGGGGSGGTLWFQAEDITVTGSLTCTGGSGGSVNTCGHCGTAGAGGAGAEGLIWLGASNSLSTAGTVNPSYLTP